MAIHINSDGSVDAPRRSQGGYKDADALVETIVFGEGPVPAQIMLVGERPGKWEAIRERPFCGPAGGELDRYLEGAGLRRDQIYVTNLVKTFRGYAKPTPEEVAEWLPFLHREITLVRPQTIGLLGTYAVSGVMSAWWASAVLQVRHGRPWRLPTSNVVVVPMYHPASGLYNDSPGQAEHYKRQLEWDFKQLALAHHGEIEGGIRYVDTQPVIVRESVWGMEYDRNSDRPSETLDLPLDIT